MTWCSGDAGGSRSSRASSRSASLRTLGQLGLVELLAQLSTSACSRSARRAPPGSRGSAGAARTRAGPSRARTGPATGSCERISTTSSSRARISESRRNRLPTSSSSSSCCFSCGRQAEALRRSRWVEQARIVHVGDHDLELLGQVRNVAGDVVNVCCTLRVNAVSSGVGMTTSGGSAISATRYGSVDDPAARPGPVDRPGSAPGACRRARGSSARLHRRRRSSEEIPGRRHLDLGVPARDHRNRAIASQHVVDQLDAPLLTHVERDQHLRERDGVPSGAARRPACGNSPVIRDGDLARAAGVRAMPTSITAGRDSLRIGTEWTCDSVCASGSSTRSIPSS